MKNNFSFNNYLINIEFNINNIYLTISDNTNKENIFNNIIYFINITEQYLLEEIKFIKDFNEFYNILINLFSLNTDENIRFKIINNINDLLLSINIYLIELKLNFNFNLKLEKKIIEIPQIINNNFINVFNNINELNKQIIVLQSKLNKLENEPYYIIPKNYNYNYNSTYNYSPYNPIKLTYKNKHFYISQHKEYNKILKNKFINIYYNNTPLLNNEFNILNINKNNEYKYNCKILANILIKYDIKHLILNNIRLLYSFNNIHIKKYEINIDKNFIKSLCDYNNSINFKFYVLNNSTIDYLILNQNMTYLINNLIDKNNTMKILKGIILNNYVLIDKDKNELLKYCELNNLNLIIN